MTVLGVQDAHLYRLHDFRRGHADDLFASGAPLVVILKASDWKSAVFLSYLKREDLEARAVLAAHMDELSDGG